MSTLYLPGFVLHTVVLVGNPDVYLNHADPLIEGPQLLREGLEVGQVVMGHLADLHQSYATYSWRFSSVVHLELRS